MKINIWLCGTLLLVSQFTFAMEPMTPVIETAIKIISYNKTQIRAETKDHKTIVLPRKAIKSSVMVANQFRVYDISLDDWLAAHDRN